MCERINALTFAYGSGLAGVAGVMMSGFKTVFPDMGTPMVVDGFHGRGRWAASAACSGRCCRPACSGEINGVVASVTNDILARAVVFGVVILIIIAQAEGPVFVQGTLSDDRQAPHRDSGYSRSSR